MKLRNAMIRYAALHYCCGKVLPQSGRAGGRVVGQWGHGPLSPRSKTPCTCRRAGEPATCGKGWPRGQRNLGTAPGANPEARRFHRRHAGATFPILGRAFPWDPRLAFETVRAR